MVSRVVYVIDKINVLIVNIDNEYALGGQVFVLPASNLFTLLVITSLRVHCY